MELADARRDLPLLARLHEGEPITFLDSASTTPKPRPVIDAVTRFYERGTANVHRGVHLLGEEATEAFEAARSEVASFLGCAPGEIVFTRNATAAINLVAAGLGLGPEDEVLLPALEHHANYLPWRVQARVVPLPLGDDGLPLWEQAAGLFTARTKLLAMAHVSNVTGVVAPIAERIREAHAAGALVLIDASQSASHLPLDVRALDCDFLVFSGHKLFGPSGVGVLYVKESLQERLRPLEWGGGMVERHGREDFRLRAAPYRFEAGTPNIEGVIGTGAAIAWLRGFGMERVAAHGREIGAHLVEALTALPGLTLVGRSARAEDRIGLTTFHLDVAGLGPQDLARALSDQHGILVSGGQHCAHILHDDLQLPGTVRASAHLFTTHEEIDRLAAALHAWT